MCNFRNKTNIHYKDISRLKVSHRGINFIKQWESFSARAFWDYKQYSIGYGTKAKHRDEMITEREAAKRLLAETEHAQRYLKKHVKVPLTQNMYDALVSFTFNVGIGWLLNGSNTLDILNKGKYEKAAKWLTKWNKAGGKVLKGLVRRRAAEKELFLRDS